MNSMSYAFVAAGIRTEESLPEVPEVPVQKPQTLVERETVLDGGARVCELNTNTPTTAWISEHQIIRVGCRFRLENGERSEYVNFVVHDSAEEKIGEKMKCFFKIDRLTYDDGAVYHEVVLRPTTFGIKADTRVIVGIKQCSESDIRLATGGFIAVLPLLKKV